MYSTEEINLGALSLLEDTGALAAAPAALYNGAVGCALADWSRGTSIAGATGLGILTGMVTRCGAGGSQFFRGCAGASTKCAVMLPLSARLAAGASVIPKYTTPMCAARMNPATTMRSNPG